MASYHCTVKAGSKGRAAKHSDYISRAGQYEHDPAKGQGKQSKLEDLEHTTSKNMPAWAEHAPSIFWKAADEHERANGATYREIEIALPREMTPEQRIQLVEEFIQKQLCDRHALTYAIHIPKAAIEKGDQPHAHVMYSEKVIDGIARDPAEYFKRYNAKNPEKGGCKKDSAGTKERLLETRELWAKIQNQNLEKCGYVDRVTHLSLNAQGINRQPEKHFGPIDSRKIDAPALVDYREAVHELEITQKLVSAIDVTAELEAEIAAATREVIRQAQATAEQARTEFDAEKVAALAAEQARADAQRQAAELAAYDREIQNEKEDDRTRKSAMDAIAKSSAATGENVRAAGESWGSIVSTIGTSERNLIAARGFAADNAKLAGKAERGIERRKNHRTIEGFARATYRSIEHLIRKISIAAKALITFVAAKADAALGKKPESADDPSDSSRYYSREANMAPVPVVELGYFARRQAERKAAAAPVPALKQITSITLAHCTENERQLAKRIEAAVQSGKKPELMSCLAVVEIVRESANKALAATTIAPVNKAAIARQVKQDQNEWARKHKQPEPWYTTGLEAQAGACAGDVLTQECERDAHLATKRPDGMFAGAAKKTWDATADSLSKRAISVSAATKMLKQQYAAETAARVAKEAAQIASKVSQNAPQHAAAVSRIAAIESMAKIIQQAIHALSVNNNANVYQPPANARSRDDFER
jgi:hypothetical protein